VRESKRVGAMAERRTYPSPMESPLELARIDPTIVLFQGPALLRRGREALALEHVQVFVSARPSWAVRFDGTGHSTDPKDIDRALGQWEAEKLVMPGEQGRGAVFETTTQLGGDFGTMPFAIKASGELREMEIGGATKFRQLVFHIANLPDFHGSPIADGSRTWTGRLQLLAGDWKDLLDSRPQMSELMGELRAQGGFAITHVGELSNSGQSFTRDEAEEVLAGLHWFLSFVRGAWTSPILLSGRSVRGAATWRSFKVGRTDAWGGWHRWCDWTNWGAAQEAYTGFTRLWADPVWQQGLRVALGQYVTANKPNPLETAIVVAQSGLELLGWLQFVESSKVHDQDWRNARRYPAERKIRNLLQLGNVDLSIPPQLASLRNLDSSWRDGPAVVAGVRNRLAHPRSASGKVGWPGQVLVDTWLLISRYLELALLHAMDVRSGIRNRLGSSQWTGATANPPWVP
jgi:hypothetical protein